MSGHEMRGRRNHARSFTAKGGTVFLIEVPLAASRFSILHQNIMTLPHVAIEVLHDQRLALLSPGGEFFPAVQKVRVAMLFEGYPGACAYPVDLFLRAKFSGLHHLDAGGLVAVYRGSQTEAETGGLGPVDADVIDRKTPLSEPFRMMPHGGQEKGGARFV